MRWLSSTIATTIASTIGLLAVCTAMAGENWQAVDLPGNSAIVGMGELPFPDGQRAVWASSEAGTFRRIDGQWQRWPLIDEADLDGNRMVPGQSHRNPVLRDLLVAPDEDGRTGWWLATASGLLLTGDGRNWTHHSTADTALADNDIRVLHLSQSQAGQPEVWIGSGAGLTIWRMGAWEAVLARADGFQGGLVSKIRGLIHNGQRQTWVAGPDGLSRFQGGRWQRWATDCLRGHRLNDIQTLEHQGEMVLLAGTDRALLALSLDDAAACQPVVSPMPQAGPVLALGRDRHERLYALMPHRIERFGPAGIAAPDRSWTFFDHRDGLDELTTWQGGHRLDAEGRLWAGSQTGLWRLQVSEPPGPPERRPPLALGHGQSRIDADTDTTLSVGHAEPDLTLHPGPSARPHARRYRVRLASANTFGPWQHETRLKLEPLAIGQQYIEVEMADEYGRIHGPYGFALKRQWPWRLIAGLMAIISLALAVSVVWLRRGP